MTGVDDDVKMVRRDSSMSICCNAPPTIQQTNSRTTVLLQEKSIFTYSTWLHIRSETWIESGLKTMTLTILIPKTIFTVLSSLLGHCESLSSFDECRVSAKRYPTLRSNQGVLYNSNYRNPWPNKPTWDRLLSSSPTVAIY